MIRLESDATSILVSRLSGSRIKCELSDEVVKSISLRIEEPTLKQVEAMVAATEGFSRNVVLNMLIWGGLELVQQQLEQREQASSLEASGFKLAEEAKEKK